MINLMTRAGLLVVCGGLAMAQAQNTDPPATADQAADRANAAFEQPRTLQRYSEYPVPWPAGLISDSVYELEAHDEQLRNATNLPRSVWPYFNNDQFNAPTNQSYDQSPYYWSEVNTPASAGFNSYVDETVNRVATNDGQDRRNADDRNGTRGSDRPGSERVTWSGNVHAKTNTTQSPPTSRIGDRNGTRGKDLPNSERVIPSYSYPTDKNRTPAGYDRSAERTHSGDNATGSNARTPNRNYPDNTASANARARTLGSDVGQNRGDNRDRWSQRPTGLQRMSGIRGSHIVSSDGTRLGAINELVVDPQSGRIAYAITGENDRRIAIPWNAMQHGTGSTFQLNMDAARFRNAPTFDPNNWPNMTESRWEESLQGYYKVTPGENNANIGTPIRKSSRP